MEFKGKWVKFDAYAHADVDKLETQELVVMKHLITGISEITGRPGCGIYFDGDWFHCADKYEEVRDKIATRDFQKELERIKEHARHH